jgi:D-tyrosyl-tRNA(Tyr) deacylase
VQRVREASVIVDGRAVGAIAAGLLVYLGVGIDDANADAAYLAEKVRYLRCFPDDAKPMNRDVVDAGGAVLLVSAFTTLADARKGRRPAFTDAAAPELAEQLYLQFCADLSGHGVHVEKGQFRAHMDVIATNDGPICILLDSKKAF